KRRPSEPRSHGLEVRDVLVSTARGLEDDGGSGVADDRGQEVRVDLPAADVRVALRVGVDLVAAVVAVDEVDPAGDGADLVDDRLERDAAGVGVAGVEAEAHA